MLTAHGPTMDKVHSLDLGADDVTKPFDMPELPACMISACSETAAKKPNLIRTARWGTP